MNLSQSEELIRKKILTILGSDKQLISMAQVRLYTSSKETNNSEEEDLFINNDEWLYSNLEGIFCYILDFSKKCRYFRLFENTTFQLLFQMEIYQNFSNLYIAVDPQFHCFEINNFFIGLQFSDLNSANNFHLMIKKLNDQIVQMMLDSKGMKVKESRKEIKNKFYNNCEIIKKNFGAENKYNRDYCEDCMEIRKPIFYEMLNFMSYNREKKEFEVGNVPKEFRNLFKNMGIKKHMLKRADTTLNFFKYFIESIDVIETVNKRNSSDLSMEDDDDIEKEDIDNDISTEHGNENLSTMQSEYKSVISDNSHVNMQIKNNLGHKEENINFSENLGNLIIIPEVKKEILKAPPVSAVPLSKKPVPPPPKINLPIPTIINNNDEVINSNYFFKII